MHIGLAMENQPSMGDQFLAVIKLIIEDNIGNENFSVSDLAKKAGLSRSMLHRKLIRLTGRSATIHITEIRLTRARELIENDVATISEVAYMVGFSSPSYFNKVFKRAYNLTPGEVRKKDPGKLTYQTAAGKVGVQDLVRPRRSRLYATVGTKLLMVFIVAAAAFLLTLELVDVVSHSVGLPERTLNMMIVLLCAGFLIAILFSWIYDLQTDVGLGKTRSALMVKEAALVVISNRRKIATYISIVVIITLVILNLVQRGNEEKRFVEWDKSIAVLPFQNDSSDEDNEYFINGLMESITNSLCKIEDLIVSSRASVEHFRDTAVPIPEVAEFLNVNYLLMGSLQKYGDHIRLTLKLIDKDGRQLWSKQYYEVIKGTEDDYDLQSEIAQQVASELHASLTPEEVQIIERIPTANIRALGLYRKGRDEHMKYMLNNSDMEALRKASVLYRSALKEDSSFGQAYIGLALAIHDSFWAENWMNRKFSQDEIQQCRDSILYLANTALYYDQNLEEAYLVRGNCYEGMKEYYKALEEYNKALQINPNFSQAYNARSEIMFYQKEDWFGGLENKLRALELERGDLQFQFLSRLGDFYEMMGFSDKAMDVYSQILSVTGDSATYYYDMAGTAYCERNWTKRLDWFKKSLEFDPDQVKPYIAIADSYFKLGNVDSACQYTFLAMDKGTASKDAIELDFFAYTALLQNGRIDEANQTMDRLADYLMNLLELNEGDRDIYLLVLADIFCNKNQYEKAMDYLKQVDSHALKPLWYIIELERFKDHEVIWADQEFQLIRNAVTSRWQGEHEKVRIWMDNNGLLQVSNPAISSIPR